MLDKYKVEQPFLYEILSNSIKKNKISHAYLFETNNNSNAMDIIYSFVKELLCPRNVGCGNCNICSRIDNGNYLELKVINPDGLQIKKEQLSELQDEFNKVSIENDRKIYIINECEKMNLQASNSILKFLEEPIDNVTAILVTNNINAVLSTILSRCQLISLNRDIVEKTDDGFANFASLVTNSVSDRNEFLNDEKKIDLYNSTFQFIDFLDKSGIDTFIYSKSKWMDIFKDRKDNIFAFDILINFYYDVLKYKVSGQVSVFVDKMDFIEKFIQSDIEDIVYKIDLFIELKNMVSFNVNLSLIIDYMILCYERR